MGKHALGIILSLCLIIPIVLFQLQELLGVQFSQGKFKFFLLQVTERWNFSHVANMGYDMTV